MGVKVRPTLGGKLVKFGGPNLSKNVRKAIENIDCVKIFGK